VVNYVRPFLYPKQEKAIFTPKRWTLCEASTKSGKTVASILRIIEWGLFGTGFTKDIHDKVVPIGPGQHFWWVAPVSDQARIAFTRVKQRLTPGTFTSRESPTPTIELVTGADIVFKSGDNPDSLYGEDVYGGVIDEASRCRPDSWYAFRSTLTATTGPAVIIGNVKGRSNWFYEFCRRVEAGNEPNGCFSRITWEDAVRAGVLDLDEIEDARRNLPEMVFKELYDAVASDDSGNPFGEDHIYACVRDRLSDRPPIAFGVDLAKKKDYLVVTGLDDEGNVCVFQRWQGVPWKESIRRIHEICGEDVPVLVDSTGIGDPVLEELQEDHGNFKGYNFTAASKQKLMEGLAVSIQSHTIGFPDGHIKTELLHFEFVLTATGVRYNAAEGWADDCVCSLALARQQWSSTSPGQAVMEFWATQHKETKAKLERDYNDPTPRPFKRGPDRPSAPAENLVHNELTELYNKTLESYQPAAKTCHHCGEAVLGPSRVTDGFHTWHEACI
jgi:hypothetical protein